MTSLMKSEDGLMWRGALGGALGAPIFLIGMALYEKLRIGYVVYGGALEIGALPIFLVIGAVLGATIGVIIWGGVATLGRAKFPAIIRATIGALFILIFLGVIQVLSSEANNGLIPPAPMEAWVKVVLYVVSFGALPGIAARPRIFEDETKTPS
jgi:hypothetical protein